jgi:hypothetical protein
MYESLSLRRLHSGRCCGLRRPAVDGYRAIQMDRGLNGSTIF